MPTYKSLEAAARAHGAANGETALINAGTWLYRNRTHLVQGWEAYGIGLVQAGVIHVMDKDGCRIDREKTAHGVVVRSWPQWRSAAASFVIPGPEPADRRLAVPDAVAVDTQGGYVFRNAEDGQAFTAETAWAFADKRNKHLKVPTYEVYLLVKAER